MIGVEPLGWLVEYVADWDWFGILKFRISRFKTSVFDDAGDQDAIAHTMDFFLIGGN